MWHGDEVEHVVVVVEGLVKVWRVDAAGHPLVLAVRGPGEVLGEMGLLGDDRTRSATATAIDTCHTRRIAAGRFVELVRQLGIEGELLRHMVRRFREGEDMRAELAVLPSRLRVARGLVHLAEWLLSSTAAARAGPVDVGLNQKDLAHAIGLHRGTVANEFARLRRHGVVAMDRRRIVVTDLERLRALSEE